MADRTRDEKLAAAKKKLQQFNKKKKVVDNNNTSPTSIQTQNDSTDRAISNGHHSRKSSGTISFKADVSLDSVSSHIANNSSVPEKSNQHRQETRTETENLMKLCSHINGILDRDSEEPNPLAIIQELEKRNYELAEILERRETLLKQVNSQLSDVKAQNQSLSQLCQEYNLSKDSITKLKTDLTNWQQQCEAQNITINSLTSEKNTLQKHLSEQQNLLQSKLQENEDLSAKLKASRQRVGDLEKKAQSSKSNGEVGEHARKQMAVEADRLRSELSAIKSSRDDLVQVNSELKSRLSATRQDKATLELTVDDLKKQLELSQVYVQQLTNQNQSDSHHEVERLQQLEGENKAFQARLSEYSSALDNVTRERDRLTKQYRSYLEQLEKGSIELKKQVESLVKERDEAKDNIALLKKQLEKKEKQILSVAEQQKDSSRSPSHDRSRQLIASFEKEMEELRQENASFRERIDAQLRDNSQLSQVCEEKETKCMELENTLSRYNEERVDKGKLLSEIQSDKTALSRALAQNRQLKLQLTELQEAFVKLSNDNMDLLSDYQHEQHVAKELAARLGQQEDELKEMRQLLTRKDEELRTLRQNYHSLTEEMFAETNDDEDEDHDASSNVFSDKNLSLKKTRQRRLSDVKHHIHLSEKLQKELSTAQLAISNLTNQNNELRSRLHHQIKSSDQTSEQKGGDGTFSLSTELGEVPSSTTDDQSDNQTIGISGDTVASLLASVSQLEAERDQLLLEVQTARQTAPGLSTSTSHHQNDGDSVPIKDYMELKKAMSLLEERLKSSLECQAQLEDANSQLEHSIGQLESETETIGEYILLYQEQRSRLRERSFAREQYIERLSAERESLQSKLRKLQDLVIQLMNQRGDSSLTDWLQDHSPTELNENGHNRVASTPLSNRDANAPECESKDWPDFSDSDDESVVEAIVPMMMEDHSDSGHHAESQHSNETLESSKLSNNGKGQTDNEMAKRILQLLNEMKNSPLMDHASTFSPYNLMTDSALGPEHWILCKCCTGALLDV